MRAISLAIALLVAMVASAQQTEAQRKYFRKTRNVKVEQPAAESSTSNGSSTGEAAQPTDFIGRYFRYESMCDWQPGMRFMVIPEQRDLILKVFADSTGTMVPTSRLRYKVMVYQGHEKRDHELHERVNFWCEEDRQMYYFPVPTLTFDDYCYTRAGVPALAYLGDVDIAREVLVGKTVFTLVSEYYRDSGLNGDGFEKVRVKKNTECTIVDVGVGTRRYPVKVIVADKDSNEFFQNVAISRTNCGIRDEEFDKDLAKHDFRGSFELLADNIAASSAYKGYIGKDTYILYKVQMTDATGQKVLVPRLTEFTIKDMRVQRGTEYVRLTLTEKTTGRELSKDVLVVENHHEDATIDGQHNNIFTNLFAMGSPRTAKDVNQQHLNDIQNGIVKRDFTEAEVEMALGKPTSQVEVSAQQYMWEYSRPGQTRVTVYFNARTKRVASVKR